MAPSQDSSDHQDYIFRFGNPELNLYLPLLHTVTGRGPHLMDMSVHDIGLFSQDGLPQQLGRAVAGAVAGAAQSVGPFFF